MYTKFVIGVYVGSKLAKAENKPIRKDVIRKYVEKINYYFVLISLCNVLFSNVLFTGKLMALACSVLGTFYILFSPDASWMLMLFFGALSFQAIAFYTVSCHKLFGIQDVVGSLKENCKSIVDKKENRLTPWERKVFHYQIDAVPTIGIKDGGFRILQSESTLLFIDFYLNNVISLLLM